MGDLHPGDVDWAARHLAECRLCPRDCRVDRRAGARGWCGAGAVPVLFSEYVHFGEEAPLAPSHTLYLQGCTLDCLFCHTAEERAATPGVVLDAELLKALVARGRAEGARNLNFLGGEPTASLPGLIPLFASVTGLPPVVWNSNMYFTAETRAVLDRCVDVYLADLKFGSASCARDVARAPDYCEVVRQRLCEVHAGAPGRLIVRHLVMPGHFDCCTRPSLEWLARALPGVPVSIKPEYLVMPRARGDARLGRFLDPAEVEAVGALARDLDLRLVAAAPPAAPAPRRPGGGARRHGDVELVVSPRGEVFARHPVREIVDLGRRQGGAAAKEDPR